MMNFFFPGLHRSKEMVTVKICVLLALLSLFSGNAVRLGLRSLEWGYESFPLALLAAGLTPIFVLWKYKAVGFKEAVVIMTGGVLHFFGMVFIREPFIGPFIFLAGFLFISRTISESEFVKKGRWE